MKLITASPRTVTAPSTRRDSRQKPTKADSCLDIVSTIDAQGVDNAVNQAVQQIGQRYDSPGGRQPR